MSELSQNQSNPNNSVNTSNNDSNNAGNRLDGVNNIDKVNKDEKLVNLLRLLENSEPLIPDNVTNHYLNKSGFDCSDVKLKRLFSLASQKFINDIATDAFQYSRIRTSQGPGGRGRPTGGNKNKTVLTMEDLSAALSDYGMLVCLYLNLSLEDTNNEFYSNARRPEYYI